MFGNSHSHSKAALLRELDVFLLLQDYYDRLGLPRKAIFDELIKLYEE